MRVLPLVAVLSPHVLPRPRTLSPKQKKTAFMRVTLCRREAPDLVRKGATWVDCFACEEMLRRLVLLQVPAAGCAQADQVHAGAAEEEAEEGGAGGGGQR